MTPPAPTTTPRRWPLRQPVDTRPEWVRRMQDKLGVGKDYTGAVRA